MISRPLAFVIVAALAAVLAPPLVSAAAPSGPPAPAAPRVRLLSDRTAAERPAVMVVGVAHFDNPGRDVVNTKVDDVLTPARQRQMAALADALARWRPTRIAIEWPSDKQAKLDARYAAYRAGTYQLSRDERDQLGLRLAAMLGLKQVDAVDWNEEPPGQDDDYDFTKYPDTPQAKARYAALSDPRQGERENAFLRSHTLAQYLHYLNTPAHLARMNARYFDFAMIGDEAHPTGINWVASWHGRNLHIFTNLARLADRPDERVLVIYGAGHAFLLNEFAAQSGAFKVESPEPLLAAAAGGKASRPAH